MRNMSHVQTAAHLNPAVHAFLDGSSCTIDRTTSNADGQTLSYDSRLYGPRGSLADVFLQHRWAHLHGALVRAVPNLFPSVTDQREGV